MASRRNVVRVIGCVPSVVVVHETILVVVDAVAWNLGVVHPVIANQINVVVVGASALQHGHDDARTVGRRTTCGDVPSEVRVDVMIAALDMVPLLSKRRIVGHGFPFFHHVVELDGFQATVLAHGTQRLPIVSVCRCGRKREQIDVCPW